MTANEARELSEKDAADKVAKKALEALVNLKRREEENKRLIEYSAPIEVEQIYLFNPKHN